MRIGVVDQPHIHMLEGTVVSHTVLLKSLGVKDCDRAPHHRNCPQHYLITPELPFQQLVEVLPVAEGTTMGCSWICDAVGSSQSRVYVDKHLLPVFHHPVHHLAMKVSVGVVRQLPVTIFGASTSTMAYLEALLDGRKQAIAITFNLEIIKT